MATPFFQNPSASYNVSRGGPLILSGTAKNVDGTAVDISTGFAGNLQVQGNPSVIQLSSNITSTLNADGTWQILLSEAGVAKLPKGSASFMVSLSNDSFTTAAAIQNGTITTRDIFVAP